MLAASPKKSNLPRIDYLDSLRGLAALSVVISHYWYAYGVVRCVSRPLVSGYLTIIRDGFAAVGLFFVLSGLVLMKRQRRRAPRFNDLPNEFFPFLVNRIARIYIPFIAALLLAVVVRKTIYTSIDTVPPMGESVSNQWKVSPKPIGIARQALLFDPSPDHLLSQDGSLTSEMRCSFLLPFLAPLLFTRAAMFAVVVGGLWFFGFDVLIVPFALGMVIARFFNPIQRIGTAVAPITRIALLLVALTLYSCRFFRGFWPSFVLPLVDHYSWEISSLGAALGLVVVLGSGRLQRILRWSPLVWLGTVSYSVFLMHMTILFGVSPYALRWLNHHGVVSTDLANIAGLGIVIVLTVAVAHLTYRWIERPGIEIGHQWAESLRQKGIGVRKFLLRRS